MTFVPIFGRTRKMTIIPLDFVPILRLDQTRQIMTKIPWSQRIVGIATFDFVIPKSPTSKWVIRVCPIIYISTRLTKTHASLTFQYPSSSPILSKKTQNVVQDSRRREKMCPMRFLLVFFSAVLAAYIAWKSVPTSSEPTQDMFSDDDSSIKKQESNIIKVSLSCIGPCRNSLFVLLHSIICSNFEFKCLWYLDFRWLKLDSGDLLIWRVESIYGET